MAERNNSASPLTTLQAQCVPMKPKVGSPDSFPGPELTHR